MRDVRVQIEDVVISYHEKELWEPGAGFAEWQYFRVSGCSDDAHAARVMSAVIAACFASSPDHTREDYGSGVWFGWKVDERKTQTYTIRRVARMLERRGERE